MSAKNSAGRPRFGYARLFFCLREIEADDLHLHFPVADPRQEAKKPLTDGSSRL